MDIIKKIGLSRIAWYGALALLLVLLGIGSYAYRNRDTGVEGAVPQAVMAQGTPDPLSALVVWPEATPAPTEAPTRFVWPVEGEIVGAYAGDSLVWCDDLGQWQTHPAIDIAAAAGEAVAACADGVVADAWSDGVWGNVIEIEHADGYVSTYANLSTLKLVEVGQAVKAGETISAVGDSAACEASLPWHLHFGLEKSGNSVNFEEITAKNDF